MRRKGQIVSALIGIMVAVIIGVSVTISVVQDTIATANLTGTPRLLVDLLPTLIAVVLIVSVVGLIGYGGR